MVQANFLASLLEGRRLLRQDPREAELQLRSALAIKPADAEALKALSLACLLQGNFRGALTYRNLLGEV